MVFCDFIVIYFEPMTEDLRNGRTADIHLRTREVIEELEKVKGKTPQEREAMAEDWLGRASFPAVIRTLNHFSISYNQMADIANVSDGKVVIRWAKGIGSPEDLNSKRNLEFAFKLAVLVYDVENPESVKRWFKTPHRVLRGDSPITLLREEGSSGHSRFDPQLLAFARNSRRAQTSHRGLNT